MATKGRLDNKKNNKKNNTTPEKKKEREDKKMVVIERTKEFYKVIVVKIDLMCSEVVDERHFSTLEKASDFVAMTEAPDRFCITVKM